MQHCVLRRRHQTFSGATRTVWASAVRILIIEPWHANASGSPKGALRIIVTRVPGIQPISIILREISSSRNCTIRALLPGINTERACGLDTIRNDSKQLCEITQLTESKAKNRGESELKSKQRVSIFLNQDNCIFSFLSRSFENPMLPKQAAEIALICSCEF